ncbi:hypothetical protein RB653_008321 [Dictyostelium firmibasis]|uniref:Uncharacterized protein n=1 Tax=Dictyostelium firmibasis TaxID=79012 RepID=A0AAN7TZW8_9MYCE
MVKPQKNTQTTPSKSEIVVEQQMEEQEKNVDTEGKVEIDTNSLKKNKQFNQFASTDRPKDVKKKVKITPSQKKKKLKGIENAINRIEKDQVFLEKKTKKMVTKKKWNNLY